jgi:N-formylglutamate deformylase
VQLEMTQCSYMEEVWPFIYRPDRAQAVQPHLRHMLEAVLDFVKGTA